MPCKKCIRLMLLMVVPLLSLSSVFAEDRVSTDGLWRTYRTGDGLGLNRTRDINADPRGGVWAGTFGGGVSYFDGTTWKTYTTYNSGLESNDIVSVAVDRNNVVWFGAGDGHVTSYDGVAWKVHYDSPTCIHNIVVDRNNIKWIASNGDGLGRCDDISMTIYTKDNSSAINNIPVGLAVDFNNSLWVGYYYDRGVSRITGNQWETLYLSDDIPVYDITAMGVDKNGSVWMACSVEQYGVWRSDPDGTVTYYGPENLVSGKVWDLAIDHDNVVWFAEDGGVSSFDGVAWRHYTAENSGLANNIVIGVTVDTDNVKWFATVYGVSSFNYQSGSYIMVTSPDGGELWERGSTQTVSWFSKDVTSVRIEYSTDGGVTWSTVADNIKASDGRYTWSLPDIDSHQMLLRIADTSNPAITDVSNNVFTVAPPFVMITSPNGGERWSNGKQHTITWVSLGVSTVSLEYSSDNGNTWHLITGGTGAPSGEFIWTPPDIDSSECLVRITDIAVADRTDVSDRPFIISSPYIIVLSPNGGEEWEAFSTYTIRWVSDGVEQVLIEYSVDGGLSWNTLKTRADANKYTFVWRPTVGTMMCLVRVTDADNVTITDESDNLFSIEPMTSVDATMPWDIALYQNIPNPFNGSTTIHFSLPAEEHVTLAVYTIHGQTVETVTDEYFPAGYHAVSWTAKGCSSGIYFAVLRAGNAMRTMKMLYMK